MQYGFCDNAEGRPGLAVRCGRLLVVEGLIVTSR